MQFAEFTKLLEGIEPLFSRGEGADAAVCCPEIGPDSRRNGVFANKRELLEGFLLAKS